MILLPLCPASPTHKNPQRRKIIHDMHPVGQKDWLIYLNMCVRRNNRPDCVISAAVIMAFVYRCIFLLTLVVL